MPEFNGISHVALTVSDLDRSVAFYESIFGGRRITEIREKQFSVIVLVTSGGVVLGLHSYPNTAKGDRFDEFRIGLDHLSFSCPSRDDVEGWATKLDELGVTHSPIVEAPYGHVLVFRDPDNIQLEFIAGPSGS